GAGVCVASALLLGEHDDEQEGHDDGAGVDDDGGHHQEGGGQQQEQPGAGQHDEGERQGGPSRALLGDEQGAAGDGEGAEHVERQRLLPDTAGLYQQGTAEQQGQDAGDEPPEPGVGAGPGQQEVDGGGADEDGQPERPLGEQATQQAQARRIGCEEGR